MKMKRYYENTMHSWKFYANHLNLQVLYKSGSKNKYIIWWACVWSKSSSVVTRRQRYPSENTGPILQNTEYCSEHCKTSNIFHESPCLSTVQSPGCHSLSSDLHLCGPPVVGPEAWPDIPHHFRLSSHCTSRAGWSQPESLLRAEQPRLTTHKKETSSPLGMWGTFGGLLLPRYSNWWHSHTPIALRPL